MRLACLAALVVLSGCNYSSVKIPDGLPPDYVRSAVERALASHADDIHWETLPSVTEAGPPFPQWRLHTAPHYSMCCGAWNGFWGFPLYWYHHGIEVYEDHILLFNYGYGANLWLGVLSMALPVYTSGGLHESLQREIQVAKRLYDTAPELKKYATRR